MCVLSILSLNQILPYSRYRVAFAAPRPNAIPENKIIVHQNKHCDAFFLSYTNQNEFFNPTELKNEIYNSEYMALLLLDTNRWERG